MTNRTLRRLLQAGFTVVLVAALYFLRFRGDLSAPHSAPPTAPAAPTSSPATPTPVTDAFRAHRSNVEVETGGRVLRMLPDDRQGAPHERFILRVEGGPSVLVAHNLDLAPRVPLAVGDSVELRGEYEWNPQGGVIHWTHGDPEGRHSGGWIRHAGRHYR